MRLAVLRLCRVAARLTAALLLRAVHETPRWAPFDWLRALLPYYSGTVDLCSRDWMVISDATLSMHHLPPDTRVAWNCLTGSVFVYRYVCSSCSGRIIRGEAEANWWKGRLKGLGCVWFGRRMVALHLGDGHAVSVEAFLTRIKFMRTRKSVLKVLDRPRVKGLLMPM